jgi:short-subunit dehydrogenase
MSSWIGSMKRDLHGQRILLTGASKGIGRALAERLAGEGARLLLVARSGPQLEQLAETLRKGGADVVSVAADVTAAADRARLLDAALERFHGLDVLINNAGIASFGHFADSTEAILRQIMEVNFFAPAELIRLSLPLLREGRQPVVVNVASMCGRRAMPAWPEYSASKYALCGLTEALRGEVARFDMDVLLVLPGLTASEFQKNMLRNEGRMKIDFAAGMTPAQTAEGIVRALRRNQTETVLGSDARWMLLFNRFFPRWLDRLIARRVRKLYEESAVKGQESGVRGQESTLGEAKDRVRDVREAIGASSSLTPNA